MPGGRAARAAAGTNGAVPLAAAIVLVAVLAGCTAATGLLSGGRVAPPNGDDPVPLNATDGQLVATGRITDEQGRPAGDVMIFVVADPPQAELEGMHAGDSLDQAAVAAVTSAPDGSFALRLVPDGPLREIADANGGVVNLELQAFEDWPSDRPGRIGFFAFPLRVDDTGFVDLPPEITLELHPVG